MKNKTDLSFQKSLIDRLISSFCDTIPSSAPQCPSPSLSPLPSFSHTSLNSAKKRKVAAYIRISTGSAAQRDSFEAQEQYFLRRIAQMPDCIYAGIYFDYAVSGTHKENRIGFQRLLRHCKEGKIDQILCKSISRFFRNTAEFLEIIHLLQTRQISVFFEEEQLDTSKPIDEFVLTTLAAIAQEESRSLSENTKKNIRMRFLKGEVCFHQIYGYRVLRAVDPHGQVVSKIAVDPQEADVVRMIYHRFLEGEKMAQIARTLNRMLIPYPLRRTIQRSPSSSFPSPDCGWTGQRIRQILTNERYTGDALCQKTYKRDVLSKCSEKNKGQVPAYLVRDHHPSIITKEEFTAAQKLLSAKRVPSSRKAYPLSGRIVCGQCGRIYHLFPGHSIFRRWSCPHAADKKNSRLVCCEPWLYEIQLYRAVKKGFAQRFKLYTLLKEQRRNTNALTLFFRSILAILQDSSHDDLCEDERSALRRQLQIDRQRLCRKKQRADSISDLLLTMRQNHSAQEISSDPLWTLRTGFIPDDTSLDHLKALYQKCLDSYHESLAKLIQHEAEWKDLEQYWQSFERDASHRTAAISWLLTLPHTSEGLHTFFCGLETVYFRAWIMKITVISPDTFELFWCDRQTSLIHLSGCLETKEDIQAFLTQKWPW